MILMITELNGTVFGAFCGTALEVAPMYSGSGETFLWTQDGSDGRETVTVYPWSRANDYFQMVHADQLAFGGGSGGFGIMVNGDLLTGSTRDCATFSSKPLVASLEFEVLRLDVWGIVDESGRTLMSREFVVGNKKL